MKLTLLWGALFSMALSFSGCGHQPPKNTAPEIFAVPRPLAQRPPEPLPEPLRIPSGCERNLSGMYALEGMAGSRYRIDDDGVRARIVPAAESSEAPALALDVFRTPDGFVGALVKTASLENGRHCTLLFQASVAECRAGELLLFIEDALEVGDDCDVVDRGPGRQEKLVRAP